MSNLQEKKFIFVTGPERTGTTMFLRFLSEPSFAVAIGGKFASVGYEKQSQIINRATEVIWGNSKKISLQEKERKKELVTEMILPREISHVVYKRSFPFVNEKSGEKYYPKLTDVFDLNPNSKIIVMKRDPEASRVSLVSSQMEEGIEAAAVRNREGIRRLNEELAKVGRDRYKVIEYDDFTENPSAGLEEIEAFVDYPEGFLKEHLNMIKKPGKSKDFTAG